MLVKSIFYYNDIDLVNCLIIFKESNPNSDIKSLFDFKLQLVKVIGGARLKEVECPMKLYHAQHFQYKTKMRMM